MSTKSTLVEIKVRTENPEGDIWEERFRIYPCRHVGYNLRQVKAEGGAVPEPAWMAEWCKRDHRLTRDRIAWATLDALLAGGPTNANAIVEKNASA